VAGGFGASHVPNTLLVANDLAGTAHRVASSVGIFRASFSASLIEASCDITLNVLLYLCLTIYGYGFGIFATFYGTAAVVRGYLTLRSGYLPRGLGAILILGGASFIAKNFLVILAPQYDLPYVIVPMFLAMVSLTLWLLIKGVDRARWDARMDGRERGAVGNELARYRRLTMWSFVREATTRPREMRLVNK
jgi:hypothetical protein